MINRLVWPVLQMSLNCKHACDIPMNDFDKDVKFITIFICRQQ